MFPQDSFFFFLGDGSGKGPMVIHKEINHRGSRMYKDPFPRDFKGLLGKEASKRETSY